MRGSRSLRRGVLAALRCGVTLSLLLPLSTPARAQDEPVTLSTNLVNVDVTVVDKKGEFVADLTAEEFTVFENGVRQTIEFFDPPLVRKGPAAPSAETSNIISLVLDEQTTEPSSIVYAREGTLRYVREQLAPSDTVSVFAVGGGLRLVQPFTRDKAVIAAAVERAYSSGAASKADERAQLSTGVAEARERLANIGPTQNNPIAQREALLATRALERFVLLRSQLGQQQSRPVLAAIAALCEAQRAIPGKKTVVLFSQGFVSASTQDWQVQATIDLANRANVTIYVVDPSGVRANVARSGTYVPSAPLEGVSATAGSEQRIRAVGGENVFDHIRHEGTDRQQDVLHRIANETGGKLIRGTNDIAEGLGRVDREIRARYTLAYASTDPSVDGNFRKIKVEVRRPGLRVAARAGYNAIAPDEVVLLSPEEKRLLDGVAAAEAKPAMPLAVEASPFRSFEGRYVVPVAFEVPPGAVTFEKKGEERHMQLDVLGVVRGGDGEIVARLGGGFDVRLTAAQYQAIAENRIFYRQDVELDPGEYGLDLVVRDRLSGGVSARRLKLSLPEQGTRFSATPAVLSRHVEIDIPTIGSTEPADVLSADGVRIRPSPGRAFASGDNLIVFLKLYNAATDAATGKPFVRVTLIVARDGKAVMRPVGYDLTEVVGEPVPHLAFAKFVRLAGLAPGAYTVKIEARDMVTLGLIKQEASFVVTP
jgi:VWFA-related protein